MMTTTTRRLAGTAAAAAVTVVLAGCAGSSDAGPSAVPETQASEQEETPEAEADPTAHNEADTEFAQMMIVHHEGAIAMARLAGENASTEEVRALGERIAAAQGPEIETMSEWLTAWGEDQPDDADMGGMGHDDMQMEGMDQEAVMDELSELTGPDLDRRFLELMIDHHNGAIRMSRSQLEDGENADAMRLARTIIDDQMAEITEMTNLLNEL